MSLLRNQTYWATTANDIRKHRPVPGATMADKEVLEILKIACLALSDLVKDKDFHSDVKAAIALARDANPKGVRELPEFGVFIDEFIRAEKNVLLQAGVDMDTTEEILRYVSELAKLQDSEDHLDRLDAKIGFCAKLACRGHDDLVQLSRLRPIHEDMKKAVYGVVLIGIDTGAAAAAGGLFPAAVAAYPIIAGVAKVTLGVSIRYGAKAVWHSVVGRW